MSQPTLTSTPLPDALASCWFCGRGARRTCQCGRHYCSEHRYETSCIVCALGHGLFDGLEVEPVSDLVKLSLAAASGDPYIAVPSRLQGAEPLPLAGVERLVSAAIKMLQTTDLQVRRRAVVMLGNTITSWPTMNPSQVQKLDYGTSLLSCTPLRQWLLHVLKHSRATIAEPIATAILDRLIAADFRDLYPPIAEKLQVLRPSSLGTRVYEVFQTIAEFYPTNKLPLNERCELAVYTHFMNRKGGVGPMMERLFGPKLNNAPILAKALKRGIRQADYEHYREWYPGETEWYD